MTETRNDEWWKKSRQTLNRLFEGYYKDYGLDDGGKIIRAIIEVLGGCRLTIPEQLFPAGGKSAMPTKTENIEALLALYACLTERFGEATGRAVMRKFIIDLKNCRISFPDWEDLYREERNRKIRALYPAYTHKQLSVMFSLNVSQVWRIVNDGE